MIPFVPPFIPPPSGKRRRRRLTRVDKIVLWFSIAFTFVLSFALLGRISSITGILGIGVLIFMILLILSLLAKGTPSTRYERSSIPRKRENNPKLSSRRFCTHCGQRISSEDVFCLACGAQVAG